MKDVGIDRNSDLLELGVDEYEHLSKPKKAKKENKLSKKLKSNKAK